MMQFLKSVPLSVKVLAPIIAVLVFWIGGLRVRLARVEAQREWISFHADSISAASDTTRMILLLERDRERLLFGDSIALVQKLVLQIQQRRDSLDRLLRLERRALLSLTATVDSLRAVVTSRGPVTETPEGVRSATFQVDSVPFHGSVSVQLPRPPASGSLALNIGIAPATFNVRLSCGVAPAGSTVRPATVTTSGPNWLTMTLGRLEQDPEICNQATLAKRSGGAPKLGVGCTVGPALALVESVVRFTYIGASCGLTIRP